MSFGTFGGGLVGALAVALGGTAYSQSAVQWRVEDGGNGHWYQVAVVDQPLTWSAANAIATAVGSHLLSVTSAAENSFARDLSVATPNAVRNAGGTTVGPWIGAHRHPTTGEFIWTSGETWSYAAWCGGEPTGPNWEDAVCYYAASLCWNDRPGDYVGVTACLSAVLEWSADCNADGIVDYGQVRNGSLPDYDGDNVPDCCEAGTPCTVGNYPVQWRVEDGGNGHWYRDDPSPAVNGFMARNLEASSIGGHLATVISEAEHRFVLRIAFPTGLLGPNDSWPALGGYREAGDTQWTWVTGEPFIYAPFSPDPPQYEQTQWLMMWGINSYTPLLWWTGNGNTTVGRAIFEWSADCDADGVVDYGQILRGEVADVNGNGVPDTCDCPADINQSGTIDAEDLAYVLFDWGMTGGKAGGADINGDATVDANDLAIVLGSWGACTATPLSWATVLEASPDQGVVTNSALRKAITATGLPWRVRDKASLIELVLIPPGTYSMGCSPSDQGSCYPDESPVHAVTITQPFYVGRYEVTQSQWQGVMGANPSFFQGSGYPNAGSRPVDSVSWNTIQPFLAATGLRLLTEAEWEYAYRAGTTTAFHNGSNADSEVGSIAWFSGNASGQTHPVGQKHANGFGLHDMSGNVREWVNDWYSPTYYEASPTSNPNGPSTGSGKVLRGGSIGYPASTSRSSVRLVNLPDFTNGERGFRVAKTP